MLQWSVTQAKNWMKSCHSHHYGPIVCYAKWSKSGRERQILYHFICMWYLNRSKWLGITRQSQVHKKNQGATMGEERGGMREIGEGGLGAPTSSYKINESRVWNAKKLFYPGFIIYFQILLITFSYDSCYFYKVVAVFLLSFWISLIWEFSVAFFVVKLNFGQFHLSLQRSHLKFFDILCIFKITDFVYFCSYLCDFCFPFT